MDNYLQILEESLQKKKDVLQRIQELNLEQESILKNDPVSDDAFDETIDKKGMLIEELNKLDEGFENLYEHIREQLSENRERYKLQIAKLQQLIKEVTDSSVVVQTQEMRNRMLVEQFFLARKRKLRDGRLNSKAALDYYRNMNQSKNVQPQFMDKKK